MRLQPSRPLLAGVAVAYGTSLLLFTGASIYLTLAAPQIEVELGWDGDYVPVDRVELVRSVKSNSPAEKAGLLSGDRIVAIEGERLTDAEFQNRIWMRHKPGDQIHLTIARKGVDAPVLLTGTFRRRPEFTWGDRFGRGLSFSPCLLLASVASQVAMALENMQLAEEIAARLETERRAEREMEIAREVQARLLPQTAPRLATLECAARCVQARAVGGDYYDFLDLGPGRLGLVLADVSGKGVHAALLVAHLEAYLRSQSSILPSSPSMCCGR